MGRHSCRRPDVTMTVAAPSLTRAEQAAQWALGRCWLCEDTAVKPVTWVGPVIVHTLNGPQKAPLYACAPCLTRIAARTTEYRRERGL